MISWLARTAIFLRLTVPAMHAATNPGDNAAEFKALCAVIKLAKIQPSDLQPGTEAEKALKEIEVLNMSVADEKWQKQYGDGTEKFAWSTFESKLGDTDPKKHWKENWQNWLDTKKRLEAAKKTDEWKHTHPAPASSEARQVASKQIAALTAAATKLYQDFKTKADNLNTADREAVTSELAKALHGADKVTAEGQVTPHKTPDGVRSGTSCNAAASGQRLLTDLMCICAGQTQLTSKACTTTPLSTGWTGGFGNAATQQAELEAKCGTGYPADLTAENIENAVHGLEILVGRHSGTNNKGGYLGKDAGANCDGTDGNICADYTNYFKDAANTADAELPWAKHTRLAATALINRAKNFRAAEGLAERIETIKIQTESTFQLTQFTFPTQKAEAAEEELTTSKNKDCNNHKTNSTCTENKCKWEGTSETVGECKPKDGENKTNAAGTEGAAGATNSEAKKCSEKKKQEDCKDGCKWEGTECKDSSILENKQFALSMVSSAFVSLIF
ncbi:variant surface glycoprotein (VSG), putative [Trypanosoma brucei brucei TREU927]|uniref:Variant surface glycoprotein (VSG), putative n=1 Tax=Trypanosoma brucei brucei (strain 927/4 GUTat10.1) TaxID=185431 RepID=Q38CQ7_TRYB2|nr:variant surface glycoprotein [Trypanosoma brucei brucei TREU927]EAN77413.1 variant surface glycoprotein (VSG), putative [Trypanosoma brucei brucei TREU927]